MAKKPSLTTISSGYASTTTLNANFEALRQAFDNTVSRDGSVPNAMLSDLDMNSNDLINVKTITDESGEDLVSTVRSLKRDTEAALDEFTDIYLGSYAADPTTDTDGDPLSLGALYFNTSTSSLQVFDGSKFVAGYSVLPITGLPISQGGTGATTAVQALENLGGTTSDEALALAIALG